MTVSTAITRAELNGNGTAGPFECGFRILADTDLKVYVSNVQKTINTHYTIANSGTTQDATVTFTSGNEPPSATGNVVLVREVPYTQESNYQNNSALDAEVLETSLDRVTMLAQQLRTLDARTIKFADSLINIDDDATEITDVTADRIGKFVGFDSAGDVAVVAGSATIDLLITSESPADNHILRHNGSAYVNEAILDADDMAGASSSKLSSSESIKAYVDSKSHLDLIDEDNMATDSATRPPSQQSVKAYVDGKSHLSLIDEDDMATDSASRPPSQQSVKAYVDAQVDTEDTISELNDTTITGTPADNEVLAFDSGAGKWVNQTADEASLSTKANATNEAIIYAIALG